MLCQETATVSLTYSAQSSEGAGEHKLDAHKYVCVFVLIWTNTETCQQLPLVTCILEKMADTLLSDLYGKSHRQVVLVKRAAAPSSPSLALLLI